MPRRPAIITQADVARAIRAAKQAGAAEVEVQPDGKILVRMLPTSTAGKAAIAADHEIVL